jgi:hypothetical protein
MTTFSTPAFLDRDDLIICVKCAPTKKGVLIPFTYEFDSETDDFHSLCASCDASMDEI